MSSDQYLEEGFDPQSLKMSTIRSLLVKHNVEYPSNAKKPELLGILQESVLTKAPKLRKEARRRVKGDGHDIEMVAGTSAAAVGSRTRSQTPRTERVRPPALAAKARDEAQEEDKPKAEPAVKDSGDVQRKKKKKSKKIRPVKESGKEPGKEPGKRAPKEEQLTPPRSTLGKAADIKRTAGTKRKLSDAEQSADSGDEDVFTPARRQMGDGQKLRIAKHKQQQQQSRGEGAGHGGEGGKNFSDDNPFQSSPEATRKRRRMGSAEGRPTTPMSALRKSQVSDLSFRVALPKASVSHEESSDQRSSPPAEDAELPESPLMQHAAELPDLSDDLLGQQRLAGRVGDLVARYQGQPSHPRPRSPTVRIRDELPRQPVAIAHGSEAALQPVAVPVVEIEHPAQSITTAERPPPPPFSLEPPRARFTMTPDAMRQLAADQSRRTTVAGGLPPVAPGIPATHPDRPPAHRYVPARPPSRERVVAGSEQPSIEQAELEAQDLQRRRVATLRQHVESSEGAAQRTHSRRSSIASIASSVGEARGIPAIPASSEKAASASASAGGAKAAAEPSSWGLRVLWLAALCAASLVWRAHEKFAIGFGSARSDYAPLAAPVGSALWLPEPVADDAPPAERALYYARYVRAAYVEPLPLECPEHADCVPYTAIPAAAGAGLVGGARDQWVVPVVDREAEAGTPNERQVAVVQCDSGYVLQFPPLASRVYPLLPRCVRDESTELRVRQLVDAMVGECNSKRGRAQCAMSLMEQARELLGQGSVPAAPVEGEDDVDEIERLGLSTAELRREMWRRKSP
ncbi:hypothetical protein LPJ61_004641, partial [Coemansia biformis]